MLCSRHEILVRYFLMTSRDAARLGFGSSTTFSSSSAGDSMNSRSERAAGAQREAGPPAIGPDAGVEVDTDDTHHVFDEIPSRQFLTYGEDVRFLSF
ncbi:unnamed protein product [Urochloa humidicola]